MSFEELKKRQSVVWGAGPYERLTEHYEPLLDHLARAVDAGPGERVLDIGTGTGALAMRLARAGAEVTGVDLAPALIETARRLAAEEGLQIRYEVGDAENLPYEDAGFDVVTSSLGSMFAPDHAAVARELSRVCRPGGRLGLAHWSSERGAVDMAKVTARFIHRRYLVPARRFSGEAATTSRSSSAMPMSCRSRRGMRRSAASPARRCGSCSRPHTGRRERSPSPSTLTAGRSCTARTSHSSRTIERLTECACPGRT
jgi:ubiquinone/menaquinone biosynthesis C-methylase UbiE